MRIFDEESQTRFDEISLFLTKTEVRHLLGYLEQMLNNDPLDHAHLMSEDFQKEIMICLYDPNDIENFQPRLQKLIKEDK